MCGVVGFISHERVAERLYNGANRLQSRGEHSTGIATHNGGLFYSHNGLGHAGIVFLDYDLAQLKGCAGIAHTRYATTGGDNPEKLTRNTQPVCSDRPGMFICANGDLINIVEKTKELKDMGFSFQSEVDAKVMQNIFGNILIQNNFHKMTDINDYVKTVFSSVSKLYSELNGAYSVLCLLERGLLAFKDPHGIRPLCFAERRDAFGNIVEYAFSSESTVFNYFGDYCNIRELKPGEAIFIEQNSLQLFNKDINGQNEAFCFFEFIYFSRPDSNFKGRGVENVRKQLGKVMSGENQWVKEKCDVVVGVPGTALSAAHIFAHELGLPYENAIIKVGNKRSFQESSQQKREKAIDEKFIFIKDFVKNKRVALIDDSNVRGTTGKKIASRLYAIGAKEVHYMFFSPPIIGPCFYGIDTPDEHELIAYNRSVEEIRTLMGVNSVTYISQKGLIDALQIPRNELCCACITREYPTDVRSAYSNKVSLRRTERMC